ncbi:MAG: hypothetical protein SNI70_10075 [Rikenellaceae bacterium]
MDYRKIVAASYAPLTRAWRLTDEDGKTQSGVFTPDENRAAEFHHHNDEEWYHTLDEKNGVELIISPDCLHKRTSQCCKERYEGVDWHVLIQHFSGLPKYKELYDSDVKIIL